MADQLSQVTAINERLKKIGQQLGVSATQTTDVSGTVKFSVSFDSSSFYNSGFLKKNLEFIQKALKPLEPVVIFLKSEIPFVSNYRKVIDFINKDSNSSSISLLNVIEFAGEKTNNKVDVRVIDDLFSFNNFISNFFLTEKIFCLVSLQLTRQE